MNLYEEIEQFLEMVESDHESAKGETATILGNYIEDLKNILQVNNISETDELTKTGCLEIEAYTLVKNHGYKFRKNGFMQNLKHILKDNGADVDYWEIDNKKFDTFTEALNYIKEL